MNRDETVAKIKRLQEKARIKLELGKRAFFKKFFPDKKRPNINIIEDNINPIYQHILKSKARVVINFGGRDSGKSFFSGGQYIPLCMATEGYFRGIAIRKTYVSNKDSTYTEVTDGITSMGIDDQFNCIKSPLEVRHENGNKLIFRGMDKPSSLKSLKGINFFWYEEAEDLTQKEFDDLLIILRGNGYQRALLTFNPVDEDHFTNERFVLCPKDRILETFDDGEPKVWEIDVKEMIDGEMVQYTVLVIRSTFDDNKFIPAVRKLIIEKLKYTDPFLYEVYRKGKFAVRAGKIFTNYEEIDFDSKGWYFGNFDSKGYAVDFGFNHASCILWVARKDNCLYIFDEIYVYEKTNPELIELAKRCNIDRKVGMICDSAEPDRIREFVKSGFTHARKVDKTLGVNDQIDTAKSYDKIYINSKCKNTIKEIKVYSWKQDKHGKFIDEPVDFFDDAMACLRYSRDLFTAAAVRDWSKVKQFGG